MATTVIRHDAFGRFEVVRRAEDSKGTCEWCGNKRGDSGRLFRYGHQADGFCTPINWDSHLFCSRSCFSAYHS